MSGSPVPGLSLANWRECEARAISAEIASAVGLHDSSTPGRKGFMIPYRGADGRLVKVYRLTQEERDKRTDGKKYHFPKGQTPPISVVLDGGPDSLILLVEGSLQPLAVASWIEPGWTVLGMNGADGYHREDFTRWAGRSLYVWPDQDVATNKNVHDAMETLKTKALLCGVREVRFVAMPARGNDGADDFLAPIDPDKRAMVITNLLCDAMYELPRKPKPKKKVKTGPGAAFFDEDGEFLARTAAEIVLDAAPAALTREGKIAMYVDGVYGINGMHFSRTVSRLMDEEFRITYEKTIEVVARGMLHEQGQTLPEQAAEPLLNVRNGMVDLRSGKLLDHDPKYLSGVQLPIDYDPDATCPTYEWWLTQVIPDQIDDLEEVESQMIDPSRTPTKAAFLYGASRSGKSTDLRLMEALAGDHCSAVTLHQLSGDPFAAANVFGSICNAAADLTSAHVEDLSLFKMLTGDDLIHANRKYGRQFAFRNQAFFIFSANTLPTVSESSRAYSERIKPFRFDLSFAGREDPTIEDRMMEELPGILNRLVAAWQRRQERNGFLETAPGVRADFEARSDRVRMWLSERGRVTVRLDGTAPAPGQTLPEDRVTHFRMAAAMCNAWLEEQGGSRMGERKIIDRLTSIDGVVRVQDPDKRKGLNIVAWPVGVEMPDEDEEREERFGPIRPRGVRARGSSSSSGSCQEPLAREALWAETAPSAPTGHPDHSPPYSINPDDPWAGAGERGLTSIIISDDDPWADERRGAQQ